MIQFILAVCALSLSAFAYAEAPEYNTADDVANSDAMVSEIQDVESFSAMDMVSSDLSTFDEVDATAPEAVTEDTLVKGESQHHHHHHHHHNRHHRMAFCGHKAWMSTKPTMDQNKQAKVLMEAAKTTAAQHKDAIKKDAKALHAAWAKQPVSRDEVVAAEAALHQEAAPVRAAIRDSRIALLNLLSIDQRTAFNRAFGQCMKRGHHHGHPGHGHHPHPHLQ